MFQSSYTFSYHRSGVWRWQCEALAYRSMSLTRYTSRSMGFAQSNQEIWSEADE